MTKVLLVRCDEPSLCGEPRPVVWSDSLLFGASADSTDSISVAPSEISLAQLELSKSRSQGVPTVADP
jgi:hypothetical protein